MTLKPLSNGQRRVFNYIKFLIDTRGYGPSIREIMQWFSWMSPTFPVHCVNALERKGWLEVDRGIKRGIRLSATYKKWRKEHGKQKV